MPELTVEPCEWVVVIHRRVYVVIRRVTIGVEDYWRVVIGDDERASRRLVGYWGSFEEASHNALAYVERQLPSAWLATGTSTFHAPREMTPPKPPPPATTSAAEPPWRGPRGISSGLDTVWAAPRRERGGQR